eukprot:748352-Karenia_brevis.AAC.1
MMTTYIEGGARSSSESRSKSAEPWRKRSASRSLSKELDSVDEESETPASVRSVPKRNSARQNVGAKAESSAGSPTSDSAIELEPRTT